MQRLNRRGFSLVELSVVIAIMGIVVTLGATEYRRFTIRSKYRSALATVTAAPRGVVSARISEEKTLAEVTGVGCTYCAGNPATSWQRIGFANPPIDPWGTPFVMDENEREFGPADCRKDSFWSAGEDRVFAGLGTGETVGGDDLIVRVPWSVNFPCVNLPDWEVGPTFNY